MISLLWGSILCFLFLFLTFWTPVKPSMTPPAPTIEETLAMEAEKTRATTGSETQGQVATSAAAESAVKADQVVNLQPIKVTPELIARGKTVYMANCITCHNKDPNVKGPIGPELMDTPIEVMIIKVRTGRYPDVLPSGYVPKRKTKQMKKLPQLEGDVPAIHAWIQSMKK